MYKAKSTSNGKPPTGKSPTGNQPNDKTPNRKWIGIHFQCCQIYTRIYLNRQQTAYEGHCPKCLRKVRVMVDLDAAIPGEAEIMQI